ncbi:MAG: helix-turn-helix domain-containing protein [Oligoflexia bacterium]|nr:helix-turn-helix domain-containing protein [Oligoflexia bacterium]
MMMDYFRFIGSRLRTLREKAGYSLEKLARTASGNGITVTKDLIHNIEKCRVNTFDPNVLAAIAGVFGMSLSEFIKFPEDVDISNIDSVQLGRLLGALKNASDDHAEIAVDTVVNLLSRLNTEIKRAGEVKILQPDSVSGDVPEYVPYFDLHVAAGVFDENTEPPAPAGYIRVEGVNNRNGEYFVSKITGTSMEPLIPDGSFCLFKKYGGGSRQGKIMLVRAAGVADPESGSSFVIKRYKRLGPVSDDRERSGIEIHLLSENKKFPPIILKGISDQQINTPCEFVRTI